jgi:hypothetical protein
MSAAVGDEDILAPLRDPPKHAPTPPEPPKPHPRDEAMADAGNEMIGALLAIAHKHDLTTTEYHYLLLTLLQGNVRAACLAERVIYDGTPDPRTAGAGGAGAAERGPGRDDGGAPAGGDVPPAPGGNAPG